MMNTTWIFNGWGSLHRVLSGVLPS